MFHENLKNLRILHHLSQKELAEKISVTQQAVAKWETQKSYPGLPALVRLADFFQISLDKLVGISVSPASDSPEFFIQQLSAPFRLNHTDGEIIQFYLNLSPEDRSILNKPLLMLMKRLLTNDSEYEKQRHSYIKDYACPCAARNGNVSNLANVQQEYDNNHGTNRQ